MSAAPTAGPEARSEHAAKDMTPPRLEPVPKLVT